MILKTFVYRKSSVLRRICSVAIDAIICVCVFFLFFVLINEPVVKKSNVYQNTNKEYETLLVDSGLYVLNENNGLVVIQSDYDDHLTYFFENNNLLDQYNEDKENSTYFEYDAINNKYLEIGTEEELKAFYKEELNKAYDVLSSNERYVVLQDRLDWLNVLMIVPSLSLSVIIVFLLPSMFLKGRKTIGMLMFHLGYISQKSGLIADRLQIIFRFLLFFMFEYLLTIINIPAGLIIIISSFITMFVTKNKLSLLDILCQTVIIDDFPQGQTSKGDEVVITIHEINDELNKGGIE